MAAYSSTLVLVTVLIIAWTVTTTATAGVPPLNSGSTRAARLQLDNDYSQSNCWGSLFELQSCMGEVVLFFLNGEIYLGPSCCRAIRVVEHECWPAMLASLGFTEQEGDILRGYCDSSGAATPPQLQPPISSDQGATAAATISRKLVP
ncbi:egg cell-secreted protein 1.4-like [Carya illinoinensis]|uniref:Prolamin-like domain-containing protein n=1 Tax=Carya illinoinensis TaxID=32201 RepID=A0A8T1QSD2_CARIL|nr:egg cell-secreted protein 1.4-like [Carya illinoinensis]KAG6657387.1 hypothetical protein CIPAW_04G087400 [Carya illinoinensis]